MSVTTEYEVNTTLATIAINQLQQINEQLTSHIKEALFTQEEAAAYTKLIEHIFGIAAGAIIASHRSQKEITRLNQLMDEMDTTITWNTAKLINQHTT